MKALRTTVYTSISGVFVSSVLREEDVQVSLHQCMKLSLALAKSQGSFVVFDIFDVPEGTPEVEVSLLGVKRQSNASEEETNMAILYFWDAQALRLTKESGLVASTQDAPLTSDQIQFVFDQLKEHRAYRKQTVRTTDNTGKVVVLKEGKVSVG